MAGRSDIEAGRAYVTLYTKNSQFIKGLGEVQKSIKSVQDSILKLSNLLLVLGVSITGALAAAVGRFENMGSALNDMAARTGVSAQSLAELAYAAEQSGGSMEDVEVAIRNVQKALNDTSATNKNKVVGGAFGAVIGDTIGKGGGAFKEIGLDAEELKKLSPEEQFTKVAEALGSIKDPGARAARALEIFGKAGVKLVPMLADGAAGLRRMREEAIRLGRPTSEEVKLADDLGDAMGRLRTIANNTAGSIGAALAPSILKAAAGIQIIAGKVQKWIRDNAELIRTVGKVGLSLIAAGVSLRAFVALLGLASKGISIASAATIPFAFMLGVVRNRLTQVGKAAMSTLGSIRNIGLGMGTTAAAAGGHVGTLLSGVARIAMGFGQIGASAGMQLSVALYRGVASGAPMVARGIVRGITMAAPLVKQGVLAAASGALTVMRFHAQQMGEVFAPIGRKIMNYIGPPIRRGFIEALFFAQNVADNIGARFGPVGASIAAKLGPGVRRAFLEVFFAASLAIEKTKILWQPMAAAASRAIVGIRSAWTSVSSFANSAMTRISAFWKASGAGIASYLQRTLTGAFTRIQAVGTGAMRAIAAGARNIRMGVGGIASSIGSLASMLGSAVGGVAGGLLTTIGSFAMMTPLIFGLLNPVTLLVAAVAGGVYAWFKFSDAGKQAFATLTAVVRPFIDIARATIRGISDAFETGDLQLAGQIAFAGLTLAFIEAMDSIRANFKPVVDALVGVWDIVSFVWTSALDTLKAAWGTVAGFFSDSTFGMGADFSGFAEGMVGMFTAAARAVVEVWQGAVSSIAKMFLQSKLLTGVDMKDEERKNVQMRLANIKNFEKRVAVNQELVKKAESDQPFNIEDYRTALGKDFMDKGDLSKDAVIAQLKRMIADDQNSVQKHIADDKTLTSQANDAIDANIAGQADAFRAKLDDLDRRAKERADGMDQPPDGSGETPAEKAKAQLAELLARAAEARNAKRKADAEKDPEAPDPTALRERTFGSFSAAALGTLRSGAEDKVVAQLKRHEKLEQDQLKTDEDMLKEMKKNGFALF